MSKGFFLRLAAGNIRKHRKIYYPYILTSVLTVMMLYIISALAGNTGLQGETLAFTLGLGQWVTTIFSLVFLFYTNSFLMKRRKMEFGLLNILGMEKKHISKVVTYETLMILLLSLVLGLGAGMLLDKLLYMLLLRLLNSPINGPVFYISIPALSFSALIVSGVYGLILLNSIRQIYLSKPIELLRGGQLGEKEPKAKWVLALLGLLALGGGYYISLRVTNAVASIPLFFVAVVLVILGTYLLFTAGSIALLKMLRSSKRFYYQPNHFINVSGMIYRMKQNAVGLANISILSTMVLVIVFSTCSLWFGMQDVIQLRCPSDIYISFKEPERREENLTLVEKIADANGQVMTDVQDYEFLNFAGYRIGDAYITDPNAIPTEEVMFGDALTTLLVITLEDYNRLTGSTATLMPDEILTNADSQDAPGTSLSLFKRSYRVAGLMDKVMIKNEFSLVSVYNVQWLVVANQAVMDELDAAQKVDYGKHASNQQYYLYFNLENADDQAILNLSHELLAGFKAEGVGFISVSNRPELAQSIKVLYGGLLFIGLFLGLLFIMAMILIVYYKQISEGYDDKERFAIMRKVGLGRHEIKRSINAQILTVFFLPLITAGIHTIFSFPSVSRMFAALAMVNIPLMALCLAGSFLLFAVLYAVVYWMTAKVYYRIVSEA